MKLLDLLHLIPNGLSLSRVVLALAFPFVPSAWRPWIVAGAAATDALDGYAARHWRIESDVGRLLDPIADKIFVLLLGSTLIVEGALSLPWAIGLAARDLIVAAGAIAVATQRGSDNVRRMRPSWLGKVTTALQFVVLFVAAFWGEPPVWLLTATTVVSVATAADYVVAYVRARP